MVLTETHLHVEMQAEADRLGFTGALDSHEGIISFWRD